MFEQATLSNANASRRAWTTGLGFAGEAVFIAFAALVPVIWPEPLPKPQALLMLLTPPAPVPPPSSVAVRPRAAAAISDRRIFTLPPRIPTTIASIVDDTPPEPVLGDRIPGGGRVAGGIPGGILSTLPESTPPPPVKPIPPKPTAEPAAPKRVRTSSLELARLVHRVEPVYPQIAKLAHISGAVELTAVVGTDGRIRELKALSGNPLLIRAAIDAVSQWIYAPPILNGERVEVVAPVTVNFRLDQ